MKNYFKYMSLSKKLTLIFVVLIFILFFLANWSPYPKNPEKWFEIRYYVGGNLECLIPSPVIHSSVDLDLINNKIDIRDISITKSCDFDKGYIDLEITGLKGQPSISGLNKTLYEINRTGDYKFRIYFNSSLMGESDVNGWDYTFSIRSEISDRFYTVYEIGSNFKPWAIFFYYPTSFSNLKEGYSCNDCFSLLEGNLRIVHPDEKIYESENRGNKRFFFENEDRIVISFNPKSKLKETIKEFLSGLIISIIAGIICFWITLIKDKDIFCLNCEKCWKKSKALPRRCPKCGSVDIKEL